MISSRDDIISILPDNSIGCELGVFEGDFSEKLLLSKKFNQLYLVDLFNGPAWNFGKHYRDASILHNNVKNRFAKYPEVKVVKQDSVSFLRSTKYIFDFIYIDTIHSYEYCIQELNAAHKCIKNNGYICGHDYCLEFQGVINAVKEFSEKYQYTPIITQEKDYPSFVIQINNK
jgi:hypothetical protein